MQVTQADKKGDDEHKIKLVHYTQKNSWDCGLSCIMMVLPKKDREFFVNNMDKICEVEGFGMSTWTIDLCYLLKRFSMDFIFYTTVFGVNPDHKDHFFYEKILPKDKDRVNQRFKDAKKNGIEIKVQSVQIRELINHMRNCGPVILLTNAGYLNCLICKKNNTTSLLIDSLPKAVTFHGHYIVLCGYNLTKGHVYYRNPAYSSRTCAMEISAMNRARLCFGTDEDCILINFNKPKWCCIEFDSMAIPAIKTMIFVKYCIQSVAIHFGKENRQMIDSIIRLKTPLRSKILKISSVILY